MSWYPGATRMELQPESDAQPLIIPDQFILHSLAAPWTAQRTYEYWRDSSSLESHFGLGYAGDLGQYIGTQTRADANASANRRPNGHGAVSLESASNTGATDPWTDEQVDAIVNLGIWLHEEHMIPLRICRTWDDSGYGYHRLFSQWNPSAHACPGTVRIEQFHDLVFPRIKNGEGSMALTDTEIDQIAKAVWSHRLTSPTAPEGTDPTREAGTFLRYTDAKQAQLVSVLNELKVTGSSILSQAQSNGSGISAALTKIDAVKAVLDSLDFEQLPADVAAKLNGLRFVLQEGA